MLLNNYICLNKLLHVCNRFIVFRCASRTPQHSRPNSLQYQSMVNHLLTNFTKNSISNVRGVLDQSLVIRYSRKGDETYLDPFLITMHFTDTPIVNKDWNGMK